MSLPQSLADLGRADVSQLDRETVMTFRARALPALMAGEAHLATAPEKIDLARALGVLRGFIQRCDSRLQELERS